MRAVRVLILPAMLVSFAAAALAQGARVYGVSCASLDAAAAVLKRQTGLADKLMDHSGRVDVARIVKLAEAAGGMPGDCRIAVYSRRYFRTADKLPGPRGKVLVIVAFDPDVDKFIGFGLSSSEMMALVKTDQIFNAFIAEGVPFKSRDRSAGSVRIGFGKTLKRIRLKDNSPELTARADIALAQRLLYEKLNYRPDGFDGSLGPKTTAAIADYRKRLGLGGPARLTRQTLNWLRFASPKRYWGAIAYTRRGAYAASWRVRSRRKAEMAALGRCRKYEKRNAKCAVFSGFGKMCLAVSYFRSRRRYGVFTKAAANPDLAKSGVLNQCPLSSIRCRLVVAICADGRHKRKDNKKK